MADKSIGRRMYENVMGTPEQNEAAEKRMEERDKKNPDSMPAKINKAAKAVTGKKSEPEETNMGAGKHMYTQTTGKKSEPKMDYSYTIKEVEIPSPNSTDVLPPWVISTKKVA
jgi:hypothetical protein